MDKLAGLFAFLVLAGFLGILVVEVPSPDLVVVSGLTALLALLDYLRSSFGRR